MIIYVVVKLANRPYMHLENWKKYRKNNDYSAAVLIDLSKAYHTISHDLLIAKLQVYGLRGNLLKLIMNYLKNRYQRNKVNGSFSSLEELLKGVQQGSVSGPILFNIYLNDLFYIVKKTDICNFAEDTTPFSGGYNLKEVMENVE